MTRPARLLLALLSAVCLAACGGDDSGSQGAPPTFTQIYDQILFVRCADSACHGGGGGGAGMLDFTSRDMAYSQLVDHLSAGPSCGKIGIIRVDPANAQGSLLYLKLSATPPCGSRMPLGSNLTSDQTAMIADWIAAGALDD